MAFSSLALALTSALNFKLTNLDMSTAMNLSFFKLSMYKEFSTLSTILSFPRISLLTKW